MRKSSGDFSWYSRNRVNRQELLCVSPDYAREADAIRAVPMGEGFIDYRAFFRALREIGYRGYVAYEMCSPLRGGGSEENLDHCARQFLRYMAES